MTTKSFNLRGIDADTMAQLKNIAKQNKTSINSLILSILHRYLGTDNQRHVHHDLDKFAGTWTHSDLKKFKQATASFNKVDKELWD